MYIPFVFFFLYMQFMFMSSLSHRVGGHVLRDRHRAGLKSGQRFESVCFVMAMVSWFVIRTYSKIKYAYYS